MSHIYTARESDFKQIMFIGIHYYYYYCYYLLFTRYTIITVTHSFIHSFIHSIHLVDYIVNLIIISILVSLCCQIISLYKPCTYSMHLCAFKHFRLLEFFLANTPMNDIISIKTYTFSMRFEDFRYFISSNHSV